MFGTGSATSSAGTAVGSGFGTATAGNPNFFTVTSVGTVVITVSGSLNRYQLERAVAGGGVTNLSSYIPTAGVAATRAADLCLMPTGAWFNNPAFTVYAEGVQPRLVPASSSLVVVNNDAIGGTGINVTIGGIIRLSDGVGPVNSSLIGTPAFGSVFRAIGAFRNGRQAGCVNGGTLTNVAAATLTGSLNTLWIGANNGTFCLYGTMRRIRVWPTDLIGTDLQVATSPSPAITIAARGMADGNGLAGATGSAPIAGRAAASGRARGASAPSARIAARGASVAHAQAGMSTPAVLLAARGMSDANGAALPLVLDTSPKPFPGRISLDLDFTLGALPSGVTLTRPNAATDGLYTDAAGSGFNSFANDAPRLLPSGFLVENSATNYVLNSNAPATQTIALTGAGHIYCLWVIGTGSAAVTAGTAIISAGAGGVAVAGTPLFFTVATGGTVVVTVSGTLTRFQLESSSYHPTSYIPTAGAIATRAADISSASIASWYAASPAGDGVLRGYLAVGRHRRRLWAGHA